MSYVSLLKLSYTDRQQYKSTYEQRIGNEDCLFRLPISIGTQPAFFISSQEVLSLVADIYIRNNKLSRLYQRLPLAANKYFYTKLLLEEIQQSNTMEGVRSSKRELSQALEQAQRNPKLRFHGIVKKYNSILEQIPLANGEDIRALYDEILLPGIEQGKRPDGALFRSGSVSVYNSIDKEIHRGVNPEQRLISELNQALDWLQHGPAPQLVRIAAFHYMFGYLHPFYDGNGRLSRFISSYLMNGTLNLLASVSLSQVIYQRQKEYYRAFDTCNKVQNKGDITPFIITFLEFVFQAVDEMAVQLSEAGQQLDYYLQLIQERFANQPQKKRDILYVLVQATLFAAESSINIEQLKEAVELGTSAMHRHLQQLIDAGWVTKAYRGRCLYYSADLDRL